MKHYDEDEVVGSLFKGAEDLFDARAQMRRILSDMLQDVLDDATRLGPGLYDDPLLRETRDMVEDLDHNIGTVARQLEHLARQIKKR